LLLIVVKKTKVGSERRQESRRRADTESMSEYLPWDENDGKDDSKAFLCKMVVVGESGVGKTSLSVRFVQRTYEKRHATIGVDFFRSRIVVGGKRVLLQAWDTAGQERYSSMSSAYLKRSHTALLVVAFDQPSSLDKVRQMRALIQTHAPTCICMLVANKADTVVCDKTHLGGVDLRELAKQLDCSAGYMAVSAQDGTNVDEAILSLTLAAVNSAAKARAVVQKEADTVTIVAPEPISVKTCC